MGLWDYVKRGGTALATGGASELYNLSRKAGEDAKVDFEADAYRVERDDFALPNANERYGQLQDAYYRSGQRDAPSSGQSKIGNYQNANAAQIAQGPQGQVRSEQMGLANALRDRMLGRGGPSVAQQQFNTSVDRNLANQMAMASSARGNQNPALAMRGAAMNQARIGQDAAAQGGMLRAQEQMAAEQALGGVLSGVRGQDIGLATSQAQFGQQANLFNAEQQNQRTLQQANLNQGVNLANLQAQLAQSGMNDAMQMNYMQQLTGLDLAQLQAMMEYQSQKQNAHNAALGINANIALGNQAAQNAMTGSLLGTGGGLLAGAIAASDRNLKTNIDEGGKSIDDFLNALTAHTYKYKDEKWGKGKQTSIMAQDLEKTDIGKQMVVDTPEGKMVDYGKGFAAIVAAQAHLNKKLNRLEKKGGR